jgi:TRAP-type mannitol/chloroaromatic compound transport system permease small subunit
MDKMLDRVNAGIKLVGTSSSWLNIILVFLICIDVMMRYIFNQSFNWVIELEWHFFGLIFLLGSAYTLQKDKHVRVDIFYTDFSVRRKAMVDLLGSLFLLIPWCLIAIYTCTNYATNSFYIKENSPNPGGLPALYVIKFLIVIGFVLILIQGVVIIIQQIKTLVR